MIDYKFLEKGSAREQNRPMLTWGMGCELDGRNVLYSADGYRLHFSWRCPKDYPIRLFPFGHSLDDYDTTEAALDKFSENVKGIIQDCQPVYTLSFSDHESLRVAAKAAKAFGDMGVILIRENRAVLACLNNRNRWATFELESTMECPVENRAALADEPISVGVEMGYLLNALEAKFYNDVPVEIGVQASNMPLRVGQWGAVASIIMPKSFGAELPTEF